MTIDQLQKVVVGGIKREREYSEFTEWKPGKSRAVDRKIYKSI